MISVMEVEKRRKKREDEEEGCERLKKLKLKKGSDSEEGGTSSNGVVPTEEEVEEFYAILRRMKVAVKYFDDRGIAGKEWRQNLEKPQPELTVGHGGENVAAGGVDNNASKKRGSDGEVGITDQGFDLNAVAPEAAESGGGA